MYLVGPPSRDKVSGSTPHPSRVSAFAFLFVPRNFKGEQGRYPVHLRDPFLQEGGFTRYIVNHLSPTLWRGPPLISVNFR